MKSSTINVAAVLLLSLLSQNAIALPCTQACPGFPTDPPTCAASCCPPGQSGGKGGSGGSGGSGGQGGAGGQGAGGGSVIPSMLDRDAGRAAGGGDGGGPGPGFPG